MLSYFILFFGLSVNVSGQPEELICDETSIVMEDFLKDMSSEIDSSVFEAMVESVKDIQNSYFGGLSIEDAVENIPQSYNETYFHLLSSLVDPSHERYIPNAAIEGLLGSENGTDIMLQAIYNSEIFADAIYVLFSNFNLSCYEDQELEIAAASLLLVQPLLAETNTTEKLTDFLVYFITNLGHHYGVDDLIVDVLFPLRKKLEQTGEILDVAVMEQILESVSFKLDTVGWSQLLSFYFEQVQKAMDLEDEDFHKLLISISGRLIVEIELGYI